MTDNWIYIGEVLNEAVELCAPLAKNKPKIRSNTRSQSTIQSETDSISSLFSQPLTLTERSVSAESTPMNIVALRGRMRDRLAWLKSRLSEKLSSREAYQVLFPIVVYIDELLLSADNLLETDWQPLQLELFDIDDGGEQFYSALDILLAKEDTLSLVFECYYFCLKDGFRGLYADSPHKVEEYMIRLSARIPQFSPTQKEPESISPEIHLIDFPYHYYAFSIGLVTALFLVLQLWGFIDRSA